MLGRLAAWTVGTSTAIKLLYEHTSRKQPKSMGVKKKTTTVGWIDRFMMPASRVHSQLYPHGLLKPFSPAASSSSSFVCLSYGSLPSPWVEPQQPQFHQCYFCDMCSLLRDFLGRGWEYLIGDFNFYLLLQMHVLIFQR